MLMLAILFFPLIFAHADQRYFNVQNNYFARDDLTELAGYFRALMAQKIQADRSTDALAPARPFCLGFESFYTAEKCLESPIS